MTNYIRKYLKKPLAIKDLNNLLFNSGFIFILDGMFNFVEIVS